LTESATASARISEENQKRMRESMHTIINEATAAKAENANLLEDLATLRADFMKMSGELRATYEEVRRTRDMLQRASTALEDSERDRRSLRAQIEALQQGQGMQERRLNALESVGGSSDNIPIPKALLQPPPTKGPVP
jgi:chromosome segregation ATPase